MTTPIPEADMRTQLEETFASVRSRREAKEAVQRAADAVPTDNVEVLRERAERHALRVVDAHWGYFNDIQRQLGEQVITPLLHTVARIAAERDEARARVRELACPVCKGSGLDPNDEGDWDGAVGAYNPTTIAPCPTCMGDRTRQGGAA
jgi:hypothetical protein